MCRELTKLHEEVRRGSAAELAAHYARAARRGARWCSWSAPPRGRARAAREEALGALRELVEAGASARPAAGAVARLTGVGANELYRELTAAAGKRQ